MHFKPILHTLYNCNLNMFWSAAKIIQNCACVQIYMKVTWHIAKYGNPYSEFVLCIYPSNVHTHSSEHTPGAVGSQCCGARGAVGGSVSCSRTPQSWYWGWRERCTFTPPTYNSCRPETRTRNLWITSPTL